MKLKKLLFIFILIIISSCEEKINIKETYKYDVWLVNGNKKHYAGTVKGLSSCKYVANSKIRGRSNIGWHYECCWVTNLSRCQEVHN